MRIISLNIWCGRMHEPLIKFIKKHSEETDIFCFQEVRNGDYLNNLQIEGERVNLFNEIKEILPNFNGYFYEQVSGVGVATFVRKNIKIEEIISDQVLSAEDTSHIKMTNGCSYYPRVIQSIHIDNPKLIVHNFHGIPGNKKQDTPERELQTKRLLETLNKNKKDQIIIGDFNLDMNTNAILQLENIMRNLVREGNYNKTRNSNYKNLETLPFADYVFISKNLKIKDFKVLEDEVSDHLALLLDF